MRIVNLVEDTKGQACCGYEHGLSFYVETRRHRLLVDSGASDLLIRNAKALGVDLTKVDTVILSHGHYDHAGGILPFVKQNPQAAVYLMQTAGGDYYNLRDGIEKYIGIDKEILRLPQAVFVEGDRRIDEELFLYSKITGKRFPAKSNLLLKQKTAGGFIQDTFAHEQCLVITQGEKRILMSGCAHNGILNILDRYYELFSAWPDAVISGFHLMKREAYSAQEKDEIQRMAQELLKTGAVFFTGHCTGGEACSLMKEEMGERLQLIHSGMELDMGFLEG